MKQFCKSSVVKIVAKTNYFRNKIPKIQAESETKLIAHSQLEKTITKVVENHWGKYYCCIRRPSYSSYI